MANRVAQLPDDPVLLKQIIVRRDAAIAQIKREAAERIEAMQQRHKAEIDAILRRFYGPRSEKFDPTELLLFGVAITEQIPVDEKVVEQKSGQKLTTRRINHHKHGRRRLPDHLPRIEIVHDLSDGQKTCPCCGQVRVCIGSETSEQLEYVPASLKVLRHVRHKYACNACDAASDGGNIEIATRTAQPIEKGLPGPGTWTAGARDHEQARRPSAAVPAGEDLRPPRRGDRPLDDVRLDAGRQRTGQAADRVDTRRVKQSKVIHTDETRVPVQQLNQCRSGRIWTYIGDESNPCVVYDYNPDRMRPGPQRFLADYKEVISRPTPTAVTTASTPAAT